MRATPRCGAPWGLRWSTGSRRSARVDHVARGPRRLRPRRGLPGAPGRPLEEAARQLRASYEGWAGPGEIEGVDEVGAWLEAHRPASFKPGIIHGDYHLANVLYRFDSPDLAAIVDWELTTIGDPLLDLGWLMATWPEADGAEAGNVSVKPWDGFPTAAELVARYAGRTERDLLGHPLVRRAGLLQARHHPGRHPRPRRRRQGRGRHGRGPARPDARPLPPRDALDRTRRRHGGTGGRQGRADHRRRPRGWAQRAAGGWRGKAPRWC